MIPPNSPAAALVTYPLSAGFRDQFERAIGTRPIYFTVGDLRRLPFRALLRRLRDIRAPRLFLPLEDLNGKALLPILYILAAVTQSRRVIVYHPDSVQEPIKVRELVSAWLGLVGATGVSFLAKGMCNRELKVLGRKTRIAATCRRQGRILYLKTNLWFGIKAGGSVGHVAGVVNGLHRQGYEVDVAAFDEPILLDSEVCHRPLQPPGMFGIPSEINLYRCHRLCVQQLRQSTAKGQYAFIYQRLSVGNYAGVILSRRWECPLVLEYNGSEAWIQKHWGRELRYHDSAIRAEEVCLRHAHLVVTVSEILKEELLSRGVEPDRIVCYPNCIDPETFNPARFPPEDRLRLRTRHAQNEETLVVTFIGTFGQWHGVEVFAQAIRSLVGSQEGWLRAKKVHFLLVGDGLKMPEVKEILKAPACREFYTLTGLIEQAEAPSYLAASDIAVSPHVANADGSRFFGSPTKLFEYMAMGKAIVASNLEQIGEVLSPSLSAAEVEKRGSRDFNNRVALLCQPGDVNELCTAIRFLAEHPQVRAELGKNAREKALASFTWDHHVQAILKSMPN